jgi:hypothetical protein
LGNLSIIALGDSLTNGFVLPDEAGQALVKHPYSHRLKELMGPAATVTTIAVNGETTARASCILTQYNYA